MSQEDCGCNSPCTNSTEGLIIRSNKGDNGLTPTPNTTTETWWLGSVNTMVPYQGEDGLSVRSGSGAPANSLGNDGDFYIDIGSTYWDIYSKSSGTWTDTTANMVGQDGNDGADGASLLYGNGAPGSGLGADGDLYIDLTSTDLDVWTKSGGSWTDTTVNLKGADGNDGDDGTSVRYGAGAPGSGLGIDGDIYLNTSTSHWDVWTKASGTWSNTGQEFLGTDGNDGADGLSFRQGSGAPSSGLGIVGDSYLDNDTGNIYLKIGASSWTITGNLGSFGTSGPTTLFYAQNTGDFIIPVATFGDSTDGQIVPIPDDMTIPYYDYGNNWLSSKYTAPSAIGTIEFNCTGTLEIIVPASGSDEDIMIGIIKNSGGVETVLVEDTLTNVTTSSAGDVLALNLNVTGASLASGDQVYVKAGSDVGNQVKIIDIEISNLI